MKPVPWI